MTYDIRRPGSGVWETRDDFPGGVVPVADLPGALVRYHTGDCPLVFRVLGLSEPDAEGKRHLHMELHTGD